MLRRGATAEAHLRICDDRAEPLVLEIRERRGTRRFVSTRALGGTGGGCRAYRVTWRAPQRGGYGVSLRVRDGAGTWSATVSRAWR